MSEKFCLKWNDFHSNVSKSFSLLRSEDYLHDVTIVTDDNEEVRGHKLVLSACSEFFKNIFKRNRNPNLLLCLEGLGSKDVRNVMDYIYNGEVQIFQEGLDRFLNVAQRLKLDGLLTDQNADQEKQESLKHTELLNKEQIIQKDLSSRQKPYIKPEPHLGKVIAKNTDINEDYKYNLEVNEQIEQYVVKNSDGSYSCQFCTKSSVTAQHMRNHIETHIEGLSFKCPMCEKTFRSRPSLGMHKNKFHKNVLQR